MILFLVKVFEDKKHADDLLRGRLFVNRLSYFKNIEDNDGRGDKDEGAVPLLLTDDLVITVESENRTTGKTTSSKLTRKNLLAPPILRPNWYDHIHVYCMYAGHTGDFRSLTSANVRDFESYLRLTEDAKKLGRHAIFIRNVTEFIKRVRDAASAQRYELFPKLVEYYDAEVGLDLEPFDIGTIFAKRNYYEHQREFRLAIFTGTPGSDPICLDVGDISDIALYASTSDIAVRVNAGVEQEMDAQ